MLIRRNTTGVQSPYKHLDNDAGASFNSVLFHHLVDIVTVQSVHVQNVGKFEHGLDVNTIRFDDDIIVLGFRRYNECTFDFRNVVHYSRLCPLLQRAGQVHLLNKQWYLKNKQMLS